MECRFFFFYLAAASTTTFTTTFYFCAATIAATTTANERLHVLDGISRPRCIDVYYCCCCCPHAHTHTYVHLNSLVFMNVAADYSLLLCTYKLCWLLLHTCCPLGIVITTPPPPRSADALNLSLLTGEHNNYSPKQH